MKYLTLSEECVNRTCSTLKAYADGAGLSLDDLVDDQIDLPKELPAAKRYKGGEGKATKKANKSEEDDHGPSRNADREPRQSQPHGKSRTRNHRKDPSKAVWDEKAEGR